ncbi:pyrroline-5-carboxylate reductase dimerization domain-containing protein [Halomonas korlensis]|uniref:pyrroline-5-carboxylate reductase dimerization domain-containing protein n=1 Tax=Halomonas korlensis TaxID=463301 RepID=UPI001FE9787E|nr:pyrroline-5-carboxylate reductase dimerization domain-containing protein [Halomonas korlensis]
MKLGVGSRGINPPGPDKENTSPAQLVERFLDYGGTTTEGLNAMLDSGFRQAVHHGLDAAHEAARHTPD